LDFSSPVSGVSFVGGRHIFISLFLDAWCSVRAITYGCATHMAEDSLGDGAVLMLLYGHASFKLYSAPLEFLSSGSATSGDSLHLLQKMAKASKSYETIVAKCIH
jgi:hypothetical protein